MFLFLKQNICYGYSKECDNPFEHSKQMFKMTHKIFSFDVMALSLEKKNMYQGFVAINDSTKPAQLQ